MTTTATILSITLPILGVLTTAVGLLAACWWVVEREERDCE